MKGSVGVVGAGTMGSGIALVSLLAGYRTRVHEVDEDRLDQGVNRITSFLAGSVRRGKMTEQQSSEVLQLLYPTTNLEEFSDCDYVIEAVFEDVSVKQDLFKRLNTVVKRETLFLTNTSTLSITAIAKGCGREDQVVGMHFCNPAPLMKLVEITDGLLTSSEAMEKAKKFASELGKTYVVTHDSPGFILNYFLVPFENDCIRALEEGLATVEDIDKAIKLGLGYPMGTFELLDTVGLDVHYAVSMRLFEQLHNPRFAPPPLVTQMIDANLLGRKTGKGFYSYDKTGVFGS